MTEEHWSTDVQTSILSWAPALEYGIRIMMRLMLVVKIGRIQIHRRIHSYSITKNSFLSACSYRIGKPFHGGESKTNLFYFYVFAESRLKKRTDINPLIHRQNTPKCFCKCGWACGLLLLSCPLCTIRFQSCCFLEHPICRVPRIKSDVKSS